MRIVCCEYQSDGRIHLILDRAGYHRSGDVKKEAKKLNIKPHYLPAYSPNLNPIERLWKVMNEQVRNNVSSKVPKTLNKPFSDFSMKYYLKLLIRLPVESMTILGY
jgi:transposase